MKVIVLLSGGMDSTVLLYKMHAEHQVLAALSFNYGSKHNDKELPCAKHHADRLDIPHKVVSLDFIAQEFSSDLLKTGGDVPEGHYEDATMVKTVVPFRNGIMLAIATGLAESLGAQAVAIAAHAGDHAIYPDCRASFMTAFQQSMQLGTYDGIHLESPFVNLRKEDIALLGADLGVNFQHTWSCYKGLEVHCGTCGTCVERKEAFAIASISDPTLYS